MGRDGDGGWNKRSGACLPFEALARSHAHAQAEVLTVQQANEPELSNVDHRIAVQHSPSQPASTTTTLALSNPSTSAHHCIWHSRRTRPHFIHSFTCTPHRRRPSSISWSRPFLRLTNSIHPSTRKFHHHKTATASLIATHTTTPTTIARQ